METARYADFSLSLHRRISGRRVPLSGAVEVTHRCPLNCAHCYNNLPLNEPEARKKELTYEEHCRILDQISEAGCLWLLYTGGEIFARPDFLRIYAYAKQKGLLITLFTNGTLLKEKTADYLADWRPFSVEVTLYGRTRETYERLSGTPGSYERCLRGIRLLRDRALPLKLKAMAVTANKHEIWEMKRFAEEDLGVEFRFDSLINCRIDCSPGPLAFRLGPEEAVEMDLQDPRRMAEWQRFARKYHGPVHPPGRSDELYHCGAGVSSFSIDPYGGLSLCALSRVDTFDLRKGSFQEGWEGALAEARRKKISRQTQCTRCEIKALCGMCPANGELENRDPEEPVDYLCRVAHLRAQALGIRLKPHGNCRHCRSGSASPEDRAIGF